MRSPAVRSPRRVSPSMPSRTDAGFDRTLVDGDDDVATRDEVDLATDEPWWFGIISLHRFQRDVEAAPRCG